MFPLKPKDTHTHAHTHTLSLCYSLSHSGTFTPDTHLFSQQDVSTKTDSYKKGGQKFPAATRRTGKMRTEESENDGELYSHIATLQSLRSL